MCCMYSVSFLEKKSHNLKFDWITPHPPIILIYIFEIAIPILIIWLYQNGLDYYNFIYCGLMKEIFLFSGWYIHRELYKYNRSRFCKYICINKYVYQFYIIWGSVYQMEKQIFYTEKEETLFKCIIVSRSHCFLIFILVACSPIKPGKFGYILHTS